MARRIKILGEVAPVVGGVAKSRPARRAQASDFSPVERGLRRVALLDADASLHRAVRERFEKPEAGWLVDAYASTAEAWQAMAIAPPRLVLMDISPPNENGLACLRKLKARLPGTRVLACGSQECAHTVFRLLTAGAQGYLVKPVPPDDLPPHLHRAMAGELVLCGKARRLLLDAFHGLGRAGTSLNLSKREEEIMFCLCQHPSDKECTRALGICPTTVHAHLSRIYKKLNVHDRASALRRFKKSLLGGGG